MDVDNRRVVIHLVCGARPNFMKVAPLYHALLAEPWAEPVIVHTGQHYDANMSGSFFAEFGLPEPHVSLGVGSGSHAEQTARVMVAYEKVLQEQRPDLVVVVGDVNSTMAATLAASKLGVKVAGEITRSSRPGDFVFLRPVCSPASRQHADPISPPGPGPSHTLRRPLQHAAACADTSGSITQTSPAFRKYPSP